MKIDYFLQIILILVGALASAYAGYWFGNQPDDISTIEYRERSDGNLINIIGGADKLKITYGENELKKLSNRSYTIANTSKANLDKIKIYFDIENKNSLPIFHNVYTPWDYPKEAITLISDKNGVYIFELEYLNRSESIWDGVTIIFYFPGEAPSNITLKTGTKAVSIKEHSYKPPELIDYLVLIFEQVWWLIGLNFIVLYLLHRFFKTLVAMKKRDFNQKLNEFFLGEEMDKVDEKVELVIKYSKDEPSFSSVLKNMFNEIEEPKKSSNSEAESSAGS